uniref:C-type lectin domain-containing protein n=1 Tax=Xiphophorus couchianus TaxID=32473 RepID=A0A3B5KPP7_9TELE
MDCGALRVSGRRQQFGFGCVEKTSSLCVCSPESQAWVFYRGAEYLLANQPYNWHAVSLACQMMGAHLLSIHSREESQFIKERLRRVCVWIGLRDEDTMKWTNGKPVSYTNWSPVEPKSYLTVSPRVW